jgi:hypothetical protein
MANVLNKTSLQYLESVNTPDYPPADWMINPDLSAVAGVRQRYWKIVSGSVVEMSQAEKDAVDTAIDVQQGKIAFGGRRYLFTGDKRTDLTAYFNGRLSLVYPVAIKDSSGLTINAASALDVANLHAAIFGI